MRHLSKLFFITLFLSNFNSYSLTFKDGKQVNVESKFVIFLVWVIRSYKSLLPTTKND